MALGGSTGKGRLGLGLDVLVRIVLLLLSLDLDFLAARGSLGLLHSRGLGDSGSSGCLALLGRWLGRLIITIVGGGGGRGSSDWLAVRGEAARLEETLVTLGSGRVLAQSA